MTTAVTYSYVNGQMVQDGLDTTAGIRPPGPGVCVNCGECIPDLTKHFSHYTGYMCLTPFPPNGVDPRPFLGNRAFGDGTFGSDEFGGCEHVEPPVTTRTIGTATFGEHYFGSSLMGV